MNKDCYLGIELGSTRIKAILIDSQGQILASGNYGWENSLINGHWSYSLEQVHSGLQAAYAQLKSNVEQRYKHKLKGVKAIGISAMMHGYLAFDSQGHQLAEFRTWRNTTTSAASQKLSGLFGYNIPQRWSIAHLYQAILDNEPHISQLAYITTLSGYVHWLLTGEKLLGIGDASGMFPIDLATKYWDEQMLNQFDRLHTQPWKLQELLPKILSAGQQAGSLNVDGAILLDPEGDLEIGLTCCPPEGDAGTGMVATNAVAPRSGNVSMGTSVFAMLVLEKPLSQMHREIDLVTTPDGSLVAMVHCNNGCSDIDAWIGLFAQAAQLLGAKLDMNEAFDKLYSIALEGQTDCGGLLHYGYVAGEDLVELLEGLPLFIREPDSLLNLANFMRSQLYSSLCALRVGLDILRCEEGVQIEELRGHGGFFKSAHVGQKLMAAATNIPVTVLQSAGEGGAWGIALLAAYTDYIKQQGLNHSKPIGLQEYLNRFFVHLTDAAIAPDETDILGFSQYFERFMQGLAIERNALETLRPLLEDTHQDTQTN